MQNSDTLDQKQLHTVVSSCQFAINKKELPVKQYRTVTYSSFKEKVSTQDEDDSRGDFDNFDISSVTKDKLKSKLLYVY